MSRGSIQRRGRSSWRLKFDFPKLASPSTSSGRQTRYVTVRGTRRDAERELAKIITAAHDGTLVEPSKITVANYLRSWLDGARLAGKTLERYRQLAEQQIIPHLGMQPLQKLRPVHIADWHKTLLKSGGHKGRPLSAQTVGHAHRVLHRVLERGVETELIARNVASVIKPPKVDAAEIEVLTAEGIGPVLEAVKGHWLEPITVLAVASGARRGEIAALRWSDIDFEGATVTIRRSLEQTAAGLKFKSPKTKRGVRTISLPAAAIEALQAHRKRQLEQRLMLGQGKPDAETLVFSTFDAKPIAPNGLSRDWGNFVRAHKLPAVSFHGLRHTHVSALIASNVDLLTISRRIGHANVSTTLNVYGHLFKKQTDTTAAAVIEAVLKQ
jgi:integrase